MCPPRTVLACFALGAALLCAPPAASATTNVAAIEVTQSRGTSALTEGDAGYEVSFSLSMSPALPVHITLAGAGLVATPSVLTFTPLTARTSRSVVITAADDTLATDGEMRTLLATSTSPELAFDGLSRAVDVLVLDDDGASLALEPTDHDTTVAENGATDSVLVRLGTRPREPVSVFLGGSDIDVVPDMVVIQPEQWNVGRSVTVAARDDSVDDGGRSTTLTARSMAPDALWTGHVARLDVTILDDDRRAVRGDVDPSPEIPVSRANRPPTVPTFRLPATWRAGRNVVVRFGSRDADGDPVRYRVLSRRHAYGDRTPHDWRHMAESTSIRFDAGRIGPLEQLCLRIEAVDPMGASATTPVTCTHGQAAATTVASRYGWRTSRMRGASTGTVAIPTTRARLVYFTHTGARAELTFLRCRRCASIRMVDPDGTNRIISLRGSGRRVVSVPLNATGRRIWGFYVRGSGTVLFESFTLLRTPR